MKYLVGFLAVILIAIFALKPILTPKIHNKVETVRQYSQDLKETIAPKPTKITKSGLPDKHQINTTFVPQAPEKNWDQPWQDACEEAALLTAVYHYQDKDPKINQIKEDLESILEFENTQGWGHDINLNQMSLVLKKHFSIDSQIIENPSLEDIKSFLANNTPVVVTANGKTLFKENKRFRNGGPDYHALTILGYDDNLNKFIVHDVGTQYGAYFKYSYSLLISSIHDLPPTGKKDIELGRSAVLVLVK